MNCRQCEELLADQLAGSIGGMARADLESHLESCAPCRENAESLEALWKRLGDLPRAVPSARMDARFAAALEGWRAAEERPRAFAWPRFAFGSWPVPRPQWLAVAALVFFAGWVLGGWSAARVSATSQELELARLRHESARLRQVAALSLLQESSASDRLRGVDWSSQLANPGGEVLAALLRALATDPNTNVRLAAVDALRQFASNRSVRDGLIQALDTQPSPMVQIEVIDLLVDLGDKRSIPVLKKLAEDENVNPAVRRKAESGLQFLG